MQCSSSSDKDRKWRQSIGMKTVITTHISHLLQHKQNGRKGHSSDYEGDKTSGIYCRVVFVRCILPPTSRQVSTSIQLHGTISKKAVIFIQKAISHKKLSTMSIPPMCSHWVYLYLICLSCWIRKLWMVGHGKNSSVWSFICSYCEKTFMVYEDAFVSVHYSTGAHR